MFRHPLVVFGVVVQLLMLAIAKALLNVTYAWSKAVFPVCAETLVALLRLCTLVDALKHNREKR